MIVKHGGRRTRLTIPLSTDSHYVAPRVLLVPELRMWEVDWSRLPGDLPEPERPDHLQDVLRELNATILVEMLAVSKVFQVTGAFQRSYGDGDFKQRAMRPSKDELAEKADPLEEGALEAG